MIILIKILKITKVEVISLDELKDYPENPQELCHHPGEYTIQALLDMAKPVHPTGIPTQVLLHPSWKMCLPVN